MKSTPRTFSELAFELHLVQSSSSQHSTRTDLIIDQYPDIYIKNPEKTNRSAGGAIQIKIQGGSQKCPTQSKKCLCDGRNKTDLAALLVQEWQQPHCRAQFAGIGELYVTHGAECHKLVLGKEGISCSWVDKLCTQQEKAGTRILLHVGHASSSGHDCIIIKSPGTDARLHIQSPNQCHDALLYRYKAVTDIHRHYRHRTVTRCMRTFAKPGMHAITGCDSTSALVGKGKKQAFELVVSDSDMCEAMLMVGRSFDDNHDKQQGCVRFVCSLYGHSGEDTDSVRFKLFCSKNSQTCHLPPAKDALRYHAKAGKSPGMHLAPVLESRYSQFRWPWLHAPKALLQLLSCNGRKDHCLYSI